MKKFVFLFIVTFLLMSCEKESNGMDSGFPILYSIYFDLQDVQGKEILDNKVEMSHKMIMHNGRLEVFRLRTDQPEPEQHWFQMGRVTSPEEVMEIIRAENKVIYGQSYKEYPFQKLIFESGERHKWILEGLDVPVRDWYFLFRNAEDHSKVDTLRIHDVVIVEEYGRTFDFFWNEKPVEYHELDDSDQEFEGYVTPLRVKE